MKCLRVSLLVLLLLSLVACAKPPTAKVTAARDAVAAFADEARLAARTAFDAMDAELEAQARKGALSRSYKGLASRADEAIRLAAVAKDQARAGREHSNWLAAELVRITAAIERIDGSGADMIGRKSNGPEGPTHHGSKA